MAGEHPEREIGADIGPFGLIAQKIGAPVAQLPLDERDMRGELGAKIAGILREPREIEIGEVARAFVDQSLGHRGGAFVHRQCRARRKDGVVAPVLQPEIDERA